jgi:stage III sporulation protein AA
MKDKDEIIRIFSLHLREILKQSGLDFERLQEIRLRVGKPLAIRYGGEEYFLSEDGSYGSQPEQGWHVTRKELQETLEFVGKYSLYAYEEELRQGYLTLPGGHRVGVAGKAVLEGERVKWISCISCMNVRLSHQIRGCADAVLPWLYEESGVHHTLIISPPRCGKTTLLRDMVRQISNGSRGLRGYTVGIVDERSEIGGCYQGVPANDVGIRTDIMDACPKAEGILMMVRSMAPEVIAVDEIGRNEDIHAIETALYSGCRLLATVHGNSLEDIRSKPLFHRLMEEEVFERYVVLTQGEHNGVVHRILDGKGRVLC